MKFLAILGDSFREAVDTKVFTVQVGLGIILVLFLASYSVEPVPAQTAFQQIAADEASPWNGIAPYLAARALLRAGKLEGDSAAMSVHILSRD